MTQARESPERSRQARHLTQRQVRAAGKRERHRSTSHRDDTTQHFARRRVDHADTRHRDEWSGLLDEMGDELSLRVDHQRDVASPQRELVTALDVHLIAVEHERPQALPGRAQPHALAWRERAQQRLDAWVGHERRSVCHAAAARRSEMKADTCGTNAGSASFLKCPM